MPSSSAVSVPHTARNIDTREAGAEALDLEDLDHPAEGEALRREGQRLARRKGRRDDDQERPDQEGEDQGEHDRACRA